MSAVVYDDAVLVAADRNERRAWAEHKARLEFGVIPLVPSLVVVEVSRSPQHAQLRRFLTGAITAALLEGPGVYHILSHLPPPKDFKNPADTVTKPSPPANPSNPSGADDLVVGEPPTEMAA
jgi:hypothetical protein